MALVRLATEINRCTLNFGVVRLLSCEGLRELASLPATLVVPFPVLPWARPGLGYLGVCQARQKNHVAADDGASVAVRALYAAHVSAHFTEAVCWEAVKYSAPKVLPSYLLIPSISPLLAIPKDKN